MNALPKVFISATSGDLRSVRQVVKEALLTINCHPVEQTNFEPDWRTVEGMLRAKIEGCQALIHIVGMRYGAEPKLATRPPGTPRRSYTQMEYDIGCQLQEQRGEDGFRVYTFICAEDFPFDPNDAEPKKHQQLQRTHRAHLIDSPRVYEWPATPDDIKALVLAMPELALLHHQEQTSLHQKLDRVLDQHDPLIAYCQILRTHFTDYQNLGLPAVASQDEKDVSITIQGIFVPPTCTTEHVTPAAFDQALEEDENPALPLLDVVIEERRLVLLADPGMGKSTLTQWLVSSLAAQHLGMGEVVIPGAIPLPLILRDLVPHMPVQVRDWTWPRLLEAFRACKPGLTAADPLARPLDDTAWAKLLRSPDAFFLIDGLDEIGDLERRTAVRDAIWQGFKTHPEARFLITSRIIGYDAAEVHIQPNADCMPQNAQGYPLRVLSLGVATRFYLAPFDDAQQLTFAQNWYRPRLGEAAGTERAASFQQAVHAHSATRVIGRVPNLLYLLALLYRNRVHLPHGRAEVYADISKAYLESIALDRHLHDQPGHAVPFTLAQKESFLATIATHMQVRRAQEEAAARLKVELHTGEVLATHADLETWLRPHFADAQGRLDQAALRLFLDHVARRAGLLLPRGADAYAFAHLSFQEYYAARHLGSEFQLIVNGRDEDQALPHEEIQVTVPRLIEWSRQYAWREVFIYLVESLRGTAGATGRLLRDVFLSEDAHEDAYWPAQDGQPHRCLPAEAAQLLASLSLDTDIDLSEPQRQKLWTHLWQIHLRWRVDITGMHPWYVAGELLATSSYQTVVWQTLLSQAAESTELSLPDCPQLTDISGIDKLTQLQLLDLFCCSGVSSLELLHAIPLRILDVSGCTGVTNLEPLRALPLEVLNLGGCDGVTSLEPLSALPLRELKLYDCTGVTSLEPLRGLPLQWLDLKGCTEVTSLEPLHALPLQSLDLDGCTGVTKVEVEQLRKALPKGCKIERP